MQARLLSSILVICVTAFAGVGAVQAGDFRRFPEYAYETKDDSVDIEALRELLQQAKELQEAEDAKKAAVEGSGEGAPKAAADAPAKPGAESAEAPKPKASQAGCMYQDQKLIWEKVPGTCKP